MGTESTDALVLQLLQKVEDKKKQIGSAERPAWVTNCSFGFDPSNNNSRTNIQTVRTIEELIEIYGFLRAKLEANVSAAKELGVSYKEKDFKHQGFSFEQWETDIKMAASRLQIKVKRDELAQLEARVNALVSPEQRRQIELAQLMNELK